MAEKIATREAYGSALAELGSAYENVVVLDADLSKSTKTAVFAKEHPERFFNVGIAESNMMAVAAGLATCGKTVFASSFAMFASGRAYEQIRNSIAYPKLNVKIGATHAGVTVGEDGASHQCIEDIALMRAIPNMTVISPADAIEAKKAVEAAILHDGPVYLRFGRAKVPVLYDEKNYQFDLGKGIMIEDGEDATIIATGIMVNEAMQAREMLLKEGINVRVVDIHTIKPIDKDIITKAARETGAIVTAEEHNIIGGLGSAVSEVVCEKYPVPVERIGVKDKFGKSGKPDELMKDYGITNEDIKQAVISVIKRK